MVELKGVNRDEALRYMGHQGKPSEGLEKIIEDCEAKLLVTARPSYVYRIFDISSEPEGVRVEGSSLLLRGNDIRGHLEGCGRAALLCATLGVETDRLIRTIEITDISSAFVMDALASAAIEEVCRIADEDIKGQLDGEFLTWRFSPGYGDFPLEIQKEFLEAVNAPKRIGLCTGENNILIPRKSVTAVAGISEKPISRKRRGCACCNMSKTCAFRKRGEHCGF